MNVPQIRLPGKPAPREPAREIIQRLNMEVRWAVARKRPDQDYQILTSTGFGTFIASRIQSDGSHLLQITVASDGERSVIIAPAEQCSFMIRLFIPSKEQPEERVIIGFGACRENPSHESPLSQPDGEAKPH